MDGGFEISFLSTDDLAVGFLSKGDLVVGFLLKGDLVVGFLSKGEKAVGFLSKGDLESGEVSAPRVVVVATRFMMIQRANMMKRASTRSRADGLPDVFGLWE